MLKKKIFIGVAAITASAVTLTGVAFALRSIRLKNYKENKGALPQGFTYTAHTGCCGTADNSIAAIVSGVENGAGVVEFDLSFSADGEPILCHDEPKGGEVTLEEAFAEIKKYPDLRVNVDAKSTANLKSVCEIAEKTGVSHRIFFTGIGEEWVDEVNAQCPGVEYYLNVDVEKASKHTEEYLLSLVEKVKSSGAVGINFDKNSASKALVNIFHENGLLVSIYTVDSEMDMYEVLSYAPDNITTRNPDKLKEILAKY